MKQATNSPTLCIVSPSINEYSETFINAHIELLPAKILVLYGPNLTQLIEFNSDKPINKNFTLINHVRHSFARRITGETWEEIQKRPFINFLRKNHVDAVLAEYGPTGVFLIESCVELNIPLIVHFHGYDAYRYNILKKFEFGYKSLFKNAASIIAVSHHMKNQLVKLGAPHDKVFYNVCGVDINLFRGANPHSTSPLFIAVGRFVNKKGPILTLLAFKKTHDIIPEARLLMIGDGCLLDACKEITRYFNIDHVVEFPGALSHEQVASNMQIARSFVQHSVRTTDGDSEGTPLAVIEAGASGLPVVSTRHAGIPEVVIDGETGLLVDEGAVDNMADQMIKLASNPGLAQKLGQAARVRIAENFSIEKSISNLWEVINQAIISNSGS